MGKQTNFLLIDPSGNTLLIPARNTHIQEIIKALGVGNVVPHEDKRELWQYISQYMKGVAADEND